MDAVFDQVIANLEENHAFREVPGGGPVVAKIKASMAPKIATPARFQVSLDTLLRAGYETTPDDVGWLYRNQFRAIQAYMPLEVFAPWLETYVDETLKNYPSQELTEFLIAQAGQVVFHFRSIASVVTPDLTSKQFWMDVPDTVNPEGAKRYSGENVVVLKDVVERYPALLAAHTVVQSGFPEWAYGMACRIGETKILDPEQNLSAQDALMKLTLSSTGEDYIFGPVLWVAAKYYRRVEGDLRKPLIAEDFTQGWRAAFGKGGFSRNYTLMNGVSLTSRCPFADAVRASGEVYLRDDPIPIDVSAGVWRVFKQLNSPHAPRRQRIYRDITAKALAEAPLEEPSKIRFYEFRLAKMFGLPGARQAAVAEHSKLEI